MKFSVLEHKTNGERSLVFWDCEVIRDNSALWSGLIWIDRSCSFDVVELIPRLESSPIIVIEYPKALQNMATGQTIADVIFKIVSINR